MYLSCEGTSDVWERLVPAFTVLNNADQSNSIDAVLTNLNMFADDRNIRSGARIVAENFIRYKFELDNTE